jgi:hypothetical protein
VLTKGHGPDQEQEQLGKIEQGLARELAGRGTLSRPGISQADEHPHRPAASSTGTDLRTCNRSSAIASA